MSLRPHIGALAKALHAHHSRLAECAKSAMQDCDDDEQKDQLQKELDMNSGVRDAAMKCMQECTKAEYAARSDELGKAQLEPLPAGFTTTPPRMIPRPGQPTVPQDPTLDQIAEELFDGNAIVND